MNGVRTHGRRATWLGGDRDRRPNALNNKANGAIVSPNLDDNLPEVLRTLRTQPLFVMRLNVRRLQIVGATPGVSSDWRRAGWLVRGGRGFQTKYWMEAMTGRRYAPMAPRR